MNENIIAEVRRRLEEKELKRKSLRLQTDRLWRATNSEKVAEYKRKYRIANREQESEYKRGYYIANRERIADYKRKRHKNNPDRDLARSRKWRTDKLNALASRPKPDFCEACGDPPSIKKALHFDHCHETEKFRGWLCHHCNLALGNVKNDPKRLRQLIAYLKKYDSL